ncbi:MAG: hypothetical protein ACRD1N_05880 [Terriglobia bacterium]
MSASGWRKIRNTARWLPAYSWQRVVRRPPCGHVHLIIGLADHFEPAIIPGTEEGYAPQDVQEQRLERWCREYPMVVDRWRDSDGRPFPHTYFYPAEQYHAGLLDRLAEHCRAGWGETEIHLHHGSKAPDTAENTHRLIADFRDKLAGHGCLSRWEGTGPPRYAFVHGNFALANSGAGNCGVDDEMQILAETGCYADFTLPSAPNLSQTGKINALYECALPLSRRAPHRRGRDLALGSAPQVFPLIIQGPLALASRNGRRFHPYIENSALTGPNPPSLERLRLWRRTAIAVQGRPAWVFIKLHCHGMDPCDEEAMLGPPMQRFLERLSAASEGGKAFHTHFVTAREMVNMILAACDGREGNPGEYRDYRLKRMGNSE